MRSNIKNANQNQSMPTEATTLPSELDINTLNDIEEKLRLAAIEQQRMEEEGGIPLSAKQIKCVATYLKASQSIHKVIITE